MDAFGIIVFIVVVIIIGTKVKKAIKEEAAKANRFAEEMKRKRAGGEDGTAYTPASKAGRPAQGGAAPGSLQGLLEALAAQVAPPPVKQPPPLPPREIQAREAAANTDSDVLSGGLSRDYDDEKAAWRKATALPVEAAAVPRRKQKKRARPAVMPAAAAMAPAAMDVRSVSPAQVRFAGGGEFLKRLEDRPPWQAAFVLHEVLGKPRAMKAPEEEAFG
ncbi:MAG: hypothetical protein JW909_05030 [Planctomycetes bacterium]|nr:hypothetical protein [Planctomycetota bacterium]